MTDAPPDAETPEPPEQAPASSASSASSAAQPPAEPAWCSLSAWTVLILSIRAALSVLITVALVVLGLGEQLTRRLAALQDGEVGRLGQQVVIAAIVIGVVNAVIRWLTTRYVVDDHRVRVRSGLLFRRHRSVARSRIRFAAVSAGILARPCGVARLTFGTADSENDVSVSLMYVRRDVAGALRQELLGDCPVVHAHTGPLARVRPSWALWAPFSAVSVGIWAGVYAVVYQIFFAWFASFRTLRWLRTNDVDPIEILRALVAGPVLIAVVGAILVYTEWWWGFRLRRQPSGTLRTDHGLVVRRSATFVEARLRGVEFVQPLVTRIVRRARVFAVTTGAGTQRTILQRLPGSRYRMLLPLAPESAAAATVAAVMDSDIDLADLVGHPVKARNKRYRYAIAGGAGATALLLLLAYEIDPTRTSTALLGGAVLTALALLWASDSYRALGHRLAEHHLLVRSGTFRRATTVLQTRAVIGWTFRQSWFQYRLGLVTMIVPTSTGRGSYLVPDVGATDGVALARRVTPGVLEPHLAEDAPALPEDPEDPVVAREQS